MNDPDSNHEHVWVRDGSAWGHIFYRCECGEELEECDCP
jgi:hypothetical protein